ncbi:hypothetical protein FO519_009430 [Halicephalobus sp. NKZ332]|nr:hypothetical protein FO519_009430 [Halicephalobus sp. NKZ332]
MSQVANSVKANDFSAQLAGNIFLLCQQLKTHGQHLEQNHKSELNRCFVALRQACCRDSGQLGTPCRLKMMELVELRAMGWRPNLAHTQYYLNRPEQTQSPVTNTSSPVFTPNLHTQFNQYSQQNQQMYIPQETSTSIQVPPGYFFIPAGAPGWQNQMIHNPGGILGNPQGLGGPPQPQLSPRLIGNMAMSLTGTPNGALNPKSNKSAQLREEVTIRNCDSGKIMGVKGRRVAVVEELSKTVISFQKVDPKSKDRVLTITGSTEESIQYAKKLIDETIRRNVSPNRFLDDPSGSHVSSTASPPASAPVLEEEDDEDDDAPGISIETGQDGTLKLCCDDPEVLQAAQVALSEYLNRARRGNRMSAEERAEKKERRKSMPLQSTQPKEEEKPVPTIKETRRAFTGSTPNLAASLAEGLSIGSKVGTPSMENTPPTTKYSRDKLLEIREGSEVTEPSSLKAADSEVIAELSKSNEAESIV